MKLKHLFTMLFLAFMCVIALNTAEEASALTTPSLSWETVSYNSSNYVHTIKFTITSDGTRHFVKITRKGGGFEHTYETTEKTLTWTPSWAGEYTAFVTSHGDGTYLSSSAIDVYVGRPYDITVTGDADVVAKGQTINFIYKSSDKDATYNLHIKNASTGNDVESFPGTKNTTYPYSTKNLSPGNYYAQLYASNGTGGENGDKFWFTVVGGTTSLSLADTSAVNTKVVNGEIKYTVTLKNNTNGTVNIGGFKVIASSTKGNVELYSVSGGKGTAHGSTTATVTGSLSSLAAGGNVTIVLKVNTSNSAFSDNVTYTVQAQSGSCTYTGLDKGNGTAVNPANSGSYTFITAYDSVSVTWAPSIDPNKIVAGEHNYKITYKNNSNHGISGINFTVYCGSNPVVTVTNGKVNYNSCVTKVSTSDLGNTLAGSGGSVTLTIYVNVSNLTGKTDHTLSLGASNCTATGVSGGTTNYTFTPSASGSHKFTVAGGTIEVSVSATPSSGVVWGTINYTLTLTNKANHSLAVTDFVFGGNGVNVLVVSGGKVDTASSKGSYTSGYSNGALAVGGKLTITFSLDATKLNGKTDYTFTVSGGKTTGSGLATGSRNPTFSGGSAGFTTAGGTMGSELSMDVDSGVIVKGKIVYTIRITNSNNHDVNNVCFKVYMGNVLLLEVENGIQISKQTYVTPGNIGSNFTIEKNKFRDITVTVDTTGLAKDADFSVYTEAGHCYATGISGSRKVTIPKTSSLGFKTANTNVSIKWESSIASNKVVAGTYTYKITFTNSSNHDITNANFTVTYNGSPIISVADGVAKIHVNYATIIDTKNVVKTLTKGSSIELTVEINTSKLAAGETYTFDLAAGNFNPSGIQGSANDTAIAIKDTYSHTITVRNGDISIKLDVESVIGSDAAVGMTNGAVAEDKVVYTITFTDGTNHNLKDIVIVLRDNKDNELVTYSGGTLVRNSDLVTNVGTVTVNGKVITISGITVNAKDDSLDTYGYLTVQIDGSATSSDVVGSGENYPYDASTDAFTIMVRHDVNLLVQAGVITNIDAEKILAAMGKSGAEIYAGIDAISAVTVTDINGNTITKDGFGSNGSNLVIKLTDEYSEFIIQVNYNGGTILVPIQVTTIDAGKDETKVLDYGLPVSISKDILLGDVRLTGGAYADITNAIKGFSAAMPGEGALTLNGKFGSFSFANNAFSYVTNQFMTDEDMAYIVILVGDATGVENVDYVNVYKKLSFIPSNVIYYEDTIGSITYPVDFDLTELGELVATGESLEQDLPETGNMGFDDGSYANATDVMISGESVQKVPVYNKEVTVSFTVTGTGFELISRVNAEDAATILVMVRPEGGNDNDWVYYPVITRFDPNGNGNAEVYQVPVFRLNNGEHKTYEVQVVGLPVQDYDENGDPIPESCKPSYIYIDGIRVYNPLGLDNPLTNNYGVEQGAEFTNLRDLILAGKGMVAEWNGNITGFTAGSYYYLGTSERFTAALGSINELGAIGANNEILIRRSAGNHMVVLKVQETVVGEGLLQIGIHDIHDAKFDGDDGENLSSTVSYKTEEGWAILKADFKSGTEQYYSIDLSNCPTDGEYKLVILQVDSGFVSFTNIKHKNVEFGLTGAEVLDIYTESGYFFNEDGDMCTIIYGDDENSSEDDEVKIVAYADQVLNINTINGILATNSVENETV